MRALELKVPPPVVLVLLAFGMYFAGVTLRGMRFTLPWRLPITLIVGLSGFAINLAGLLAFRRHRTTVNPLHPERASTLVRDGIFRWTRNPMYLGIVLMLSGWAIYLSSVVAFPGPLLLLAWLTRFQIVPEERALRQSFPREFADYARSVRRWL